MSPEIVREYGLALKTVLLDAGLPRIGVLVRGSSIVLAGNPSTRIDLKWSQLGTWCVKPEGIYPTMRFGYLRGVLPEEALHDRISLNFSFYRATIADCDVVSAFSLYLFGKPLSEVFPALLGENEDH